MLSFHNFIHGDNIQSVQDYFWGRPTALINWCEADYVVTRYVAEFWNTITNIAFMLQFIVALKFYFQYHYEQRFLVCHATTCLVGIGSAAFHATLLYEMQLFDEVPMLFGILAVVYCWYDCGDENREHRFIVMGALALLGLVTSFVYIYLAIPAFHHLAFNAGVIYVIIKAKYVMHEWHKISLSKDSSIMFKKVTNGNGLETLKLLFRCAVQSYLFAGLCWIIDKLTCSYLTEWRSLNNSIFWHLFTAPSQLHALWHLGSAWATFVAINTVTFVRQVHASIGDEQRSIVTIKWHLSCLPIVLIEKEMKGA